MRLRSVILGAIGALAIAGCASERPQIIADDPSTWVPPGQGEVTIADRPVEEKAKPKPRARHLQEPNRRDNDKLQAKVGRTRS